MTSQPRRPFIIMRQSQGFTLLEVLVAMVILAIGLVGMATLQLRALQNDQSAYMRTQAIAVAKQLLDDWQVQRATGVALTATNINTQCQAQQVTMAAFFPNAAISCTLNTSNVAGGGGQLTQMVQIRIAYDDAHWRNADSVIQETDSTVVYFTRIL